MRVDNIGQTSSMGVVWPPVPYTNERLRGFYTVGAIRTVPDSVAFATLFEEQSRRFEAEPDLTRLSIRVIAHAGQVAVLHGMGVPIEGALPLFNTDPGMCIVYVGANERGRQPGEDELAGYRTVLNATRSRPRHNGDAEAELTSGGLQAHTVDPSQSADLVSAFQPLYSAFGYTADETLTLLSNPHNRIVYITDGNVVVSTAMAEVNSMDVGGLGALRVGEITEAYTLPSHRGQGLYRCASRILVERLLAEQGDELHCLYGECNLASPGVIFAAYDNGREFACFDACGVGIPGFGILPANVVVSDGPDSGGYNTFALSYVPLGGRSLHE